MNRVGLSDKDKNLLCANTNSNKRLATLLEQLITLTAEESGGGGTVTGQKIVTEQIDLDLSSPYSLPPDVYHSLSVVVKSGSIFIDGGTISSEEGTYNFGGSTIDTISNLTITEDTPGVVYILAQKVL